MFIVFLMFITEQPQSIGPSSSSLGLSRPSTKDLNIRVPHVVAVECDG